MIRSVHLVDFKNFKDAKLDLGRVTVLVGANASGKSNIRDAFRFLHGLGQGYTLAEVIGEKYVEGGLLQWKGIRGGIAEIARHGAKSFCLETQSGLRSVRFLHRLDVAISKHGPLVAEESLHHNDDAVFTTHTAKGNNGRILVQPDNYPDRKSWLRCDVRKPVLN